jgi:hypothetical protein
VFLVVWQPDGLGFLASRDQGDAVGLHAVTLVTALARRAVPGSPGVESGLLRDTDWRRLDGEICRVTAFTQSR